MRRSEAASPKNKGFPNDANLDPTDSPSKRLLHNQKKINISEICQLHYEAT